MYSHSYISLYILGSDLTENTSIAYQQMSSIVAYSLERVFLTTGCLPRICLRGKVFIEPLPSSVSVRHNVLNICMNVSATLTSCWCKGLGCVQFLCWTRLLCFFLSRWSEIACQAIRYRLTRKLRVTSNNWAILCYLTSLSYVERLVFKCKRCLFHKVERAFSPLLIINSTTSLLMYK
jgi:hypothetical protein